jgi:SAM-dependent methyltransferase
MHPTAMSNGKLFFDTYVSQLGQASVVDVGAQDVNGSLREVCPQGARYIGVDFVNGKGVDVVLTDPYTLPFENNSMDVIVSSSCFEHSEMFWILFLEILRILKPSGLFYLNAPSNGFIHRYPVDCWRFYPDCGYALVNWARRSGINAVLLESYISYQDRDVWNDFVAVFVKDAKSVYLYPNRILHKFKDFYDGTVTGQDVFLNIRELPEDLVKLRVISGILNGSIPVRE